MLCGLGGLSASRAEDAKAKEKVTYAEHVVGRSSAAAASPATTPTRPKGGLVLDNYGAAMQGGGSGKVIEPGDPDGSTLLGVITHKEEPKMPPNSPKIPDAELELIRKWIEGGALENSGATAAVKAKPKFEFKLDPSALGKPAGPPPMPENLVDRAGRRHRPGRAPSRPWPPAPGRRWWPSAGRSRSCSTTTDNHLVGVLPFPEGRSTCSSSAATATCSWPAAAAAGSRAWSSAFNVKTGERVFEVGEEFDAVLAADISPDHGQIALGGPSKVVRVYTTADGNLLFEMKKHTDWITAVEFSPDGVLLATGDRNGGLFVWEAETGREFFDLRGHTAAITDVSWRLDSNVLASSSEDGTIKLWEMENGGNIKNWRPRRRGRRRSGSPRTAGWSRPAATAWSGSGTRTAASSASSKPSATWPSRPSSPTTRRRSSPATGRARSASGTPRTASAWPTWPSTRPRSPSGWTRPLANP